MSDEAVDPEETEAPKTNAEIAAEEDTELREKVQDALSKQDGASVDEGEGADESA